MQIDEYLQGVRGFVLDVGVIFRVQGQGLRLAKAGKVKVGINEIDQFFVVAQIAVPAGKRNRVLQNTIRILGRVNLVVDRRNYLRAIQIELGAWGFFQFARPGYQFGRGEIPVLDVKTKSVENPDENKQFHCHAAQNRAQDDHARIMELAKNIHQPKDHSHGEDIAFDDLFD